MTLRSLSLLAVSVAWAAGQPQCFFNERSVDPNKMTSTFCPMEQFGGGDFIQEGSCCSDSDEGVIEAKFSDDAGALTTDCADLYKQVLCGQCQSFSGQMFARLGTEFGPWDGMAMKRDFCEAFVDACADEITLGGPLDYDGLDYCEQHVGGGVDEDNEFWSFPYTDQLCDNGVLGIDGSNDVGDVCCPLDCGQCGGNGCGANRRGRECCINGVLNTQPSCSVSGTAPCIVTDAAIELCDNGIPGIDGSNDVGDVCCPLDCGQCGGNGCGANRRGRECCIDGVLNNQRPCSVSGTAPCIVTDAIDPSPTPVPSPPTPPPAPIEDPVPSSAPTIQPVQIEVAAYRYLGCFQDGSARILSTPQGYFVTEMNAEFCSTLCDGFVYFGTQYGGECWCGSGADDYDSLGQLADADCNIACTGNSSESCGGRFKASVYAFNL